MKPHLTAATVERGRLKTMKLIVTATLRVILRCLSLSVLTILIILMTGTARRKMGTQKTRADL